MPFKDNDKKDDKDEDSLQETVPEKVNVTLPGTVEKIIPAIGNQVPEKAQIQLEGADELYREIRIDNTLEDADGNPVTTLEFKYGCGFVCRKTWKAPVFWPASSRRLR